MDLWRHRISENEQFASILAFKFRSRRTHWPFLFHENTIRQANFLHMLENYAYPLLITRQPGVMFRLDGAPAHWRAFLNAAFPQRWIGRDGPTPWPPRSPDINHLDFFFVGIREDPCIQNTCARFTESQTSHQAGIWRSHKHHAWQHLARAGITVTDAPRKWRQPCWSVLIL